MSDDLVLGVGGIVSCKCRVLFNPYIYIKEKSMILSKEEVRKLKRRRKKAISKADEVITVSICIIRRKDGEVKVKKVLGRKKLGKL